MSQRPWTRRHYRDLRDKLLDCGFRIDEAWISGSEHLKIRVSLGERWTVVTCAGTPKVCEHAVTNAVHHAKKVLRAA